MKKEILKLLESQNERLKINNFCCLHRWQKDALNQTVDYLEIEFSGISYNQKTVEIEERGWQDIVERVQKEQTKFFNELSVTLNSDLKNGYLH